MTFKVVLSAEAQKFAAAERSVAKKIAKCLLQLETTRYIIQILSH
ncbi:MAG: hypothetical protein R3E08_01215 [Thiotrichaceae bacterium]